MSLKYESINKYIKVLNPMSNQIDDLIANIQQKFDDEFKDNSKMESPKKQKLASNNNESNHNPESERKNNPNSQQQQTKYETAKKKDVTVIQQHENQQSSQADCEHKNGQKLPYREQQRSFQYHEGEEQQQDQNKYKQLSHKLETALKKISSSKKQFNTFNSTSSATKSDYLNRFQEYERKKEKDLEFKRKQEEQKKYLGLKSKPDINEKSRKLATETSYKPIYERYDKILEDKKKKLEQHQENKKQNQEQEYEQFMEEFKKHSKIQPDECRDTQTYFHDMMAWKSKLEKDRDEKVKQKEQKATEGYTFKPEINKRSERLVKNQKRVPIQEREIERPTTEQSEYTFQPKINKRRVA